MGEMSEEQARWLGRRAVACEGWLLASGMEGYDECGARLVCVDGAERVFAPDVWAYEPLPALKDNVRGFWPDFRDACTRGGLLELVREATGDAHGFVRSGISARDGRPRWWPMFGTRVAQGDGYATEAEALVAALEGAP